MDLESKTEACASYKLHRLGRERAARELAYLGSRAIKRPGKLPSVEREARGVVGRGRGPRATPQRKRLLRAPPTARSWGAHEAPRAHFRRGRQRRRSSTTSTPWAARNRSPRDQLRRGLRAPQHPQGVPGGTRHRNPRRRRPRTRRATALRDGPSCGPLRAPMISSSRKAKVQGFDGLSSITSTKRPKRACL